MRKKSEIKAIANLYDAVKDYVESTGGRLIVVGGIETQIWPNDPKGVFSIAIKCTGKPPELKSSLT